MIRCIRVANVMKHKKGCRHKRHARALTTAGFISTILGVIPSLVCCIAPSVSILGILVGVSVALSFYNWLFLAAAFIFFLIAAFLYHTHPKTCR
jgi:hypothetical protein